VDILFTKKESIRPGAVSARWQKLGVKVIVPPADTTHESTNRIVIDGARYRFEDHHPRYLAPVGTVIRRANIMMFNGTLGKTFYPDGSIGNGGTPTGLLGTLHFDLKENGLLPITLTFRGTTAAMTAYPVDRFKPSGVTLSIDRSPCEEYVPQNGNGSVSLWLDAGKQHVLRRVRKMQQDRLVEQCDVSYRRDQTWGWVPASWVSSYYSDTGALRSTTEMKVLELRINTPHEDKEFDVVFPPGCEVYDGRDQKDYIVQPDGSLRPKPPPGRRGG
jgi:hypothetical protein